MKLPRPGALAAEWRDLGPLRPVVVGIAVAKTLGSLGALLLVATWVPGGPLAGPVPVAAAVGLAALAIALVLLPPGLCAFVGGYALGPAGGVLAGTAGVALGAVVARAVLWPCLGARRFAFMRERPRAVAVRLFCAGPTPTWSVARLRFAAVFPFAVQNLLCAVAGVPARSVLLGTLVGVLPTALLAGWCGAALAGWRVHGELPPAAAWCWPLAASGLVVAGGVVGRRAWRAAVRA
ncbi:MAG: hypothetical protein KF830_02220 [Planctomycetes bacterium]|nr:hypothetical protein [Planctomycetota bacterium]